MAVKLNSMTATASVCSAEEITVSSVGCKVLFKDLDAWGVDEVICDPDSCIGTGVKI